MSFIDFLAVLYFICAFLWACCFTATDYTDLETDWLYLILTFIIYFSLFPIYLFMSTIVCVCEAYSKFKTK